MLIAPSIIKIYIRKLYKDKKMDPLRTLNIWECICKTHTQYCHYRPETFSQKCRNISKKIL